MTKFQTVTGPDDQTELATRSDVRDEDQLALDALVKPLGEAWIAAGRPTPDAFTPAMTTRIRVTKGDMTDIKKGVRRALLLHKAEPAWYQPGKPDANGAVVIKFGPRKIKPPKPKAAPAAQAPATQAPAEQPAPEQPAPEQVKRSLIGSRR
jgi:hypothetical protein